MGLLELKQHLIQAKIASLGSMAAHFRCDPIFLRSMLAHWVRKGCLRQFSKTPACGKRCVNCDVSEYEIYEWSF